MLADALGDLGHPGQRAVPARLQLAGYEAVHGIGGVVLTKGPVGGIARCLEITRHGLTCLVTPHHGLRLGSEGRLRRSGPYDGE
jgi:hypothetical protein